jgi:hypothetical protein
MVYTEGDGLTHQYYRKTGGIALRLPRPSVISILCYCAPLIAGFFILQTNGYRSLL